MGASGLIYMTDVDLFRRVVHLYRSFYSDCNGLEQRIFGPRLIQADLVHHL